MILVTMATSAVAHEMTPTYPKLQPSHIQGILKTSMKMFNKRADVEYYEIAVFDKDFEPVPFVTSFNIIKLKYLNHVKFDVFIREADRKRAVYICSKSKLRSEENVRTAVSSRICSKIK